MSCLIDRNQEGKIVKVRTPQGTPSQLFNDIHSNIFLGDAESSVKILSAAYTFNFEQEPALLLKSSKGTQFDSLEEMIISGELGESTMGIIHPNTGQFTPIAKFDTSSSDKNKFLTDQVQQGILSAERILQEDGVTRFLGKGSFPEVQKVMAQAARFEALNELGNGRTKVNSDGTFEIEFIQDVTVAEYEDETKIIEVKDIPNIIKDKSLQNRTDLISEYIAYSQTPEIQQAQEQENLKPLIDSLYSFLNSMGFTYSTLEEYRKNYNTKYGKDPDILAIADMANKVVALAQGGDISNELTEEISHIAIEAYNEQNSIVSALSAVHLTPEWKEHSEYYTEKYSPFYEGTALEDQVRKEILGKVLARQIRDNFSTENKSAQETSLIGRLQNIFNRFVESLQSIFRPHHLNSLNKVTRKIADSIIQGDISMFDKAFESDNFFYSAMPTEAKKVEKGLQATKKVLEEMFTKVLGQSTPRQGELDRIMDEMTDVEILSSVNTITSILKTQMDVLEEKVKEAANNNQIVSQTDFSRYMELTQNVIPLVNEIAVNLEVKLKPGKEQFDQNNSKVAHDLLNMIKDVRDRKNSIQPFMEANIKQHAENIFEEFLRDVTLPEEEKEKIRAEYESNIKDTTQLGKKFGIISHSRDFNMQMLYKTVVKMNTVVNNKFKTEADKAIERIYSENLSQYERDIIKKKNGQNTHYYLGFIDWTKYYEAIDSVKIDLVSEFTGKSKEDVKKLLEKNSAEEIISNVDKALEYRKRFKEETKKFNEQRFTEDYDIEKKRIFDKAGIDETSPTITTIENKNRSSFARNRKYVNAQGKIDKSQQSEADKVEDASDYKAYLSTKSAYDQFGNPRVGILRVKAKDLTVEQKATLPNTGDFLNTYTGEVTVLDTERGFTKESLDNDALVALELSHLDLVYFSEREEGTRSNKPSEDFLENVQRAESITGNAFDFVSSNASFSISSEYYENLGQSLGFIDVAREYINSLPKGDQIPKKAILEDLVQLQQSRKELLKQSRKIKNPTETDVVNMSEVIQDKIKFLDDQIANKRKDLKLPSEYYEKISYKQSGSLRTLSDDFYKMQVDSGMSMRDFCLSHMSDNNKQKVYDFSRGVEDLIRKSVPMKPHFLDFVDRVIEEYNQTGSWEELNPELKRELLKDAYAKENVASYFQKNIPQGFSEAYEALKNGDIKFSEVLENKEALQEKYPGLKYLEIMPDYTWTENISSQEYSNPNYKGNEYFIQPKIDTFFDPEFTKTYGITKEEFIEKGDDLNSYVPTNNKEQYELLKLLSNVRTSANGHLGGETAYNKFQRVQLSRSTAERVIRFKGKNVKSLFQDILQNRQDEKEYGETVYSSLDVEVKVIPKFFQTKLDTVEDVTENSIQAELLNLKEAIKYDEKKNVENDVQSLLWMIANKKYLNNGGSVNKQKILKKGEVSNYYQQAKEYVDFVLYGVKQSNHMETEILGRKVDLTQIINSFQGFVRFKNLAFNPLVDLTSLTTGVAGNLMDRVAGDFYHSSSANRANTLNTKLLSNYIAESGKTDKNSQLNHLLEFFQVMDLESRLENTSYGRGIRLMFKSHFAMSKAANLPVTPKVMLAILSDFRAVDGKFMSWTDFYAYKKSENKEYSKSEIESMWKQVENDSFYDHLEISPKGIKYNDKFVKLYGSQALAKKAFEDVQVRIIQKSKQVIQGVDGVLSEADQVAAQRDFVTNLFMMHKGWMAIFLTRRFKRKHFNLSTGQYEEGHYTTLLNFLGSVLQNKKDPQVIKDIFNSLEPAQKRNLKRVLVETGFGMSLLALGSILFGAEGDDDEDETYLGNLAELIYLRTVSEYNSTQLYSMHGSLIETLNSPIVSMRSVEDITKTPGKALSALQGDEDAGFWGHVAKQFITKRYFQVGTTDNLRAQIDSYKKFNDLTLWNLGMAKKEE